MINMFIETSTVLTLALVGALLALTIVVIFALNTYKLKQRRNYSVLNEFPFELTQGVGVNFVPYIHALVLMFTVSFILFGFYLIEYLSFFAGTMLLVSWTMTGFLIYLIFIIKFTSVKRHLLVSSALLIFTLINGVMHGLYLQFSPIFTNEYIFPIISYILAFLTLLLALNPKLGKWSYADKIEQQDGTIIVLRPRIYVLAATEWALVLINILLMVNAYLAAFAA